MSLSWCFNGQVTLAPMMLAVTCSDVVGSIGNVVSVQAIGENVVSLVVDRIFFTLEDA